MTDKCYFHYTPKIEYLCSIIENGFFVKGSLEPNPFYTHFLEDFNKDIVTKKYLLPMLCLCEIPLTQIKDHRNIYGNYAIGMNKKWVRRNGFNPVSYYIHKSELIFQLYQKIKSKIQPSANSYVYRRMIKDSPFVLYNEFMHFLKPYDINCYKKNGASHLKYNFYRENEWRYAPTQFDMPVIDEQDIKSKPELIDELNLKLLSIKKNFNISDIEYIFIDNQEEVFKFISYFKDKLNAKELDFLKLKIISINKLINSI